MTGSLTKGGLVGAIGGAVAGTVIAILSYEMLWFKMGYFTVEELTRVLGPPRSFTPEVLLTVAIANVTYNTFWGVILGLIYARTYDVIPGKGVVKGPVFGMVAYLIANIRAAQIFTSFGQDTVVRVVQIIPMGFIYFLILGLIVGALYKK